MRGQEAEMTTSKKAFIIILIVAFLANALPLSSARPVRALSLADYQDAAAAFYARFHCDEPWPTGPVEVDQVACQLHQVLRNGGSWAAYRKYGIGLLLEILTIKESQALWER